MWTPWTGNVVDFLIRNYGLVIRNYELVIRNYGLVIRSYELVIRKYEFVIRNYELLIRNYKLVITNLQNNSVKVQRCRNITIPPPKKRQIITFKTKYHVRPPIKILLCCNLVYFFVCRNW